MRRLYRAVLVALVLGWQANWTLAADPDEEPQVLEIAIPMPRGEAADTKAPPAQTATPAPAAKEAPIPPDALWNNLLDVQSGYLRAYNPPIVPEYCWLSQLGLHFLAEGGFYLMQPQFEGNPAFNVGHAHETGSQTQQFDYDIAFAPRVTLGLFLDCGLGFQTSWWDFDQRAIVSVNNSTDPTHNTTISSIGLPGIPGFTSPGPVARTFGVFNDHLRFASGLQVDVWDWEGFMSWQAGPWSWRVSGGPRYGFIIQNYDATRSNTGTGRLRTSTVKITQDSDVIEADHEFTGVGPTGALEVQRQLGASGFALYGIGRTSVLFGHTDMRDSQATVLKDTITPPKGKATSLSSAFFFNNETGQDDTFPVEDLEVGIEWRHPLGRALVFLRAGFVGEVWFGDIGNATSERGDLGFLGMTMTAEVRF